MSELPGPLRQDLADRRGQALLLTPTNLRLARDLEAAAGGLEWTVVTKEDRRGWGAGRLLGLLRSRHWSAVLVESDAADYARRTLLYRILALIGRARSRWVLETDRAGTRGEPLHPLAEWPRVVGLLAAEAVATGSALLGAWRLDRRLSRSPARSRAPRPDAGPRVAVLRTSFWFGTKAGGSVSHALGVLRGMKELGLEPRLWTTSRLPAGDDLEQTEILPAPRPSIFEEAAIAGFNRRFVDRVFPDAKRFDPGVVYHRHDAFSLAGLALARRLGVPLVLEVNASEVWAREAWSQLHFAALARSMERTAFSRADRLVLVSEALVPTVLALGGDRDRTVVNPNGVAVERFDPASRGEAVRSSLGLPPDAVVCGFLGTFTRWHGVLFLAEQIRALARAHPGLHFLLIGDGDLRQEVELQVASSDMQSRVHFTGLVTPEEVPAHLAACDILLSPHLPFEDGSEFFGSPTKLFEYMAAGRPVLASRLGQIADVVEDGGSGRLVAPGDGAGFAAALSSLIEDPAARAAMGRRGRELAVTRYTWKRNAARALEGLVHLESS